MTWNGLFSKTVVSLLLLLVGVWVGWQVGLYLLLNFIEHFNAVVIGAIFSIGAISFLLSNNSKGSFLSTATYSVLNGTLVGILTVLVEVFFPGAGVQATVGTIAIVSAVLILFRMEKIRSSAKMTQFVWTATTGLAIFGLINFALQVFGVIPAMFGIYGQVPFLGILLGLFALFLAGYHLLIIAEFAKNGVENQAEERLEWKIAMEFTGIVAWIYMELLRLVAILRGNN